MNRDALYLAIPLQLVLALAVGPALADDPSLDRLIASQCAQCHGTDGKAVGKMDSLAGESADSLGLSGEEAFDITGLEAGSPETVRVTATAPGGGQTVFEARVRIDTPQEFEYYRHGGILHYVLRQLAA